MNLILVVIALVDLAKRSKVAGGSKVLWAVIIIFIQYLGPIIYFVFGRKDE